MKELIIVAQSRSGHNFIYEQIQSWIPATTIVGKIEGYPPHAITEKLVIETNSQLKIDPGNERTYILVVRDFKNWLASYMMWMRRSRDKTVNNAHLNERIAVWTRIAEEAAQLTKFFDDKTVISYGRFKQNQVYREVICSVLEGRYTEGMLNHIPGQGSGSSFDGIHYQGIGNQMGTTQRHIQILRTSVGDWYREVMSANQQAQDLSRIFE